MTIERILGTDTGKEAFGKTDRNFVALETALNNVSGAASDITYDNTASQMTATNVQDAIDENRTQINSLETQIDTLDTAIIAANYNAVNSIPTTAKRGKLNAKLKGMSAVNLLGTDGNCESLTPWAAFQCTLALDTTNKIFGSNAIKMTASGGHAAFYKNITTKIDKTKYYFASTYLKNYNLTNGMFVLFSATGGTNSQSEAVTGTVAKRVGAKVSPTQLLSATAFSIQVYSSSAIAGQYGYADGIMVQEITADEYNNLTVDQLMAKYPYQDGLQGATGIKALSCGKNLFDKRKIEFFKYINTNNGNAEASSVRTVSDYICVKENTIYTISGVPNGGYVSQIGFYDIDKKFISGTYNTYTFTTPAKTLYLRITVDPLDLDIAQLEEGTVATAYEQYKGTEVEYKTLDGNAVTLHRLPNGTYDELLDDGKNVKRITEKTLVASDIAALYTTNVNNDYIFTNNIFNDRVNTGAADTVGLSMITSIGTKPRNNLASDDVNNIWTHSFNATNALIIFFPKGTYANLAAAQAALTGTKLIYQLAVPQILDTNATPLIAEPGGQVSIVSTASPQPSVEFEYPENARAVIEGILNSFEPMSVLFSAMSPMVFKERTILSAASDADKLGTSDKMTLQIIQGNPIVWDDSTQGLMITHKTVSGAYGSQVYVNQNGLWYRGFIASVWSVWEKIITDKQNAWITATLSNGWTGTLQYRKNQLGQLEIKTSTHITPGTLTAGTTLATLPVGYRPAIDTPIMILNYATNRVIAFLSIATDGNIKVSSADTGITAGNNLRFSAVMPM